MAIGLTARRLKFCEEYLKNPTVKGAVIAYEKAGYSVRSDYECVRRNVHKLLADKKIQEYLNEIRMKVANRMGITLEQHLERLEELGKKAEENGQYSAAISAETQRGKASGLYVEQKKIDGNLTIVWGGDDEDQNTL